MGPPVGIDLMTHHTVSEHSTNELGPIFYQHQMFGCEEHAHWVSSIVTKRTKRMELSCVLT